ncbi:MAG: hypothetical protein AAF171_10475 [Cyanobacteria bacterium P01_A01_bin.116]
MKNPHSKESCQRGFTQFYFVVVGMLLSISVKAMPFEILANT